MDFTYTNYSGKLVLNPTDFILRFEHNRTGRCYEKTFFDRDFSDYLVLGGIEFIQKALLLFFRDSSVGLHISGWKETTNEIQFCLVYKTEILPKEIEIDFLVPAIRKSSTTPDLETLEKKIASLTKLVSGLSGLSERVKELEDRCGDTIVLPGCDYAIPTDITSLTLVLNGTEIDVNGQGYYHSSMYNGLRFTNNYYNMAQTNYPVGTQPQSAIALQQTSSPTYVFHSLKSISNLKYLKNLTSLSIWGASELTDYSVIRELKNLTTLCIGSARKSVNPGNNQLKLQNAGNNPQLKDISWISGLKSLTTVSFLGCSSLVDITPMKKLSSLTNLDIRETAVKNTDFLNNAALTIVKN
jgi:hypothetical protein